MLDIHNYISQDREALVKKMQKLEKSLIHSRDESNALRAMSRKQARQDKVSEKLLEIFEKNVSKLKPKVCAFTFNPHSPDVVVDKVKHGNVVGMSDWHIGEQVSANELAGSNEVNYVVFEKRIKKYIKKIQNTNITRTRNVVVADLGDNIRGIIHGGVTDTENGLMYSIMKAVEMQSMFIDGLMDIYEEIDYRMVVGNHSRLDDQILSKNKYQDYSWLITQMLMKLYANEPRIKFDCSESGYQIVKLNGVHLGLFHGDTVRNYKPESTSSMTHVHGIFTDLFGKHVKHFFSGHTHIAKNIQNRYMGVSAVSGTLVGNNEYGTQNGFGTINVSQCMFNVDKDGEIEELIHFNLK